MSSVPILDIRTCYINSFYSNYTNTNSISTTLDLDPEYLQKVTKISVVDIYIPEDALYQFDPSDFLILIEGVQEIKINLNNANYSTLQDMINDLQNYLNLYSPNGFIYHITLNKNNNSMNIEVNDNIILKNIILKDSNHLKIAYGLNDANPFINKLTSSILTTKPIREIYVKSNCVSNFTYNNFSAPALAVYSFDKEDNRDLLANSRSFNNVSQLTFQLSDFDGHLLDINNKHWRMQIKLFYYDEAFINLFSNFIKLSAYDIKRKKEKEDEKEADKIRKQIDQIKNFSLS